MKQALTEIRFLTRADAEEPVCAAIEAATGIAPSFYSDAEKDFHFAAIYLHRRQNIPAMVEAIRERLAILRTEGIDIGTGSVALLKLKAEDWAESWKRHFKPLRIGKALLIKSSWAKAQPAKGAKLIILDPGLSFGTGNHPTTQFCLNELVKARQIRTRQAFLDIGTGSGILAIAAAKLGYTPVDAFDFDPACVRISKANAKSNRVDKVATITHKDLLTLKPTKRPEYSVICANLIYDLLLQTEERLISRLTPGGTLILAGILQTQFEKVRQHYVGAGLILTATLVDREWQSGAFRRPE